MLWRPQEGTGTPGDRGHPPAALRRLVAAQGQGRSRRDGTGHRGRGRSHEETGFRAHLGRRLPVGELLPSTGPRRRSRYWAARCVGGEFTPNDEVDELKWLPVERGDDRSWSTRSTARCCAASPQLPADTTTVLIVRHAHRGQQVPLQGRRPKAPAGQARPGSGRVAGRASSSRSVPATCSPPTACAATRRWTRWPRNSACRSTPSPTLTDEAYADNRKKSPAACARHRRDRRPPGDLHPGRGDPRPHRLVVRA